MLKKRLRNKILKIRETYNKDNIKLDYKRIINFFKKENIIAKKIGGYFPINFEFDDLDLLKKFEKDNYQISLPVIKKSFQMDFYNWTFIDPLKINNLGIPEPEAKKLVHPDILFIPMVAFDKNVNGFAHLHPLNEDLDNVKKTTFQGPLTFGFSPPGEGVYRLWAQVRTAIEEEVFIPFDLEIGS